MNPLWITSLYESQHKNLLSLNFGDTKNLNLSSIVAHARYTDSATQSADLPVRLAEYIPALLQRNFKIFFDPVSRATNM